MISQQDSDVAMRAEAALDVSLQQLQLEQQDLDCPDYDQSFFRNKGAILNFFNPNTTGATQNIGGIRLPISDLEKIPGYLNRHRQRVKRLAVKFMEPHLRFAQCAIGAGELLTDDDYSLTFSIASLSEEGKSIWAGKRSEGPMYFALSNTFTKPLVWNVLPDGTKDYAHMIHGYVALLPSGQRRSTTLKRLGEELSPPSALHNADPPRASGGQPNSKRPRNDGYNNGNRYNNGNGYNNGQSNNRSKGPGSKPPGLPEVVSERLAGLEREVKQLAGLQQPTPPLPVSEGPPIWANDGGNNGANLPSM